MAGIAQRPKAVLVVSLRSQCRPRWVLTHVPLRLYPDEKSSLQRTATRRHRTQYYEIFSVFGMMVLKIFPAFFAKYITLRKMPEIAAAQRLPTYAFQKVHF